MSDKTVSERLLVLEYAIVATANALSEIRAEVERVAREMRGAAPEGG